MSDEQEQSFRPSRMASRFFIVLFLLGSLHGYVGLRLFGSPAVPFPIPWLGAVFTLIAFGSLPLSVVAMFKPHLSWASFARSVGHLWLGCFFIFLSVSVFFDALRFLLGHGGDSFVRSYHWLTANESFLVLGLGGLACLSAMLLARQRPRLVKRRVPIKNLSDGLDGFTIVQISDVHLGFPGLDRDFAVRIVNRIQELKPDMIAITGDLVEGSVAKLKAIVAPLAELSAPHGVYYVTGNHEYYHGAESWENELRRLGLSVLKNEHVVIERGGGRLAIGGVPDLAADHFTPEQASLPQVAFHGAPEEVPRILLAHQPRSVHAASEAKVDLLLSGHTHGGQIFPFSLLVRLQQPTVQGLKKILGVWVHTHRGTGYWGPRMRLGSPSEIVVLTLFAENVKGMARD